MPAVNPASARGGLGSLRLRLLAGTLVWVALTVVVAGWGLGRLFNEHVERQFNAELGTHLEQLAAQLTLDVDDRPALRGALSDPRFARPYSGLYWQIDGIDPDRRGALRSRSLWDGVLVVPGDRPADGERHVHQAEGPDGARLQLVEQALHPAERPELRLRLIVAANAALIDEPVARFNRLLVLALGLLAVGLAVAALVQVRVGLRPLARLRDGLAAVRDGRADCEIVDIGYGKRRDLALVVPPTPLSAVMSTDQWEQVYRQLAGLVEAHRTTLVFANTRRMAERAARHLGELLGRDAVAAHHGSLAKELRLDAEQRLKAGELRVLVATASLELGLDIGNVDLVCQLGSPRSIATFLQRAGRAGHAVGGIPKARLFPQTRDELVECTALLDCVARGELDALRVPPAPRDVLAQQLVAEVASPAIAASGEADTDEDPGRAEDELYALFTRAGPYAGMPRTAFDAIVRMLAEGFVTRRGATRALVHRDAVHRRLRARRGAR